MLHSQPATRISQSQHLRLARGKNSDVFMAYRSCIAVIPFPVHGRTPRTRSMPKGKTSWGKGLVYVCHTWKAWQEHPRFVEDAHLLLQTGNGACGFVGMSGFGRERNGWLFSRKEASFSTNTRGWVVLSWNIVVMDSASSFSLAGAVFQANLSWSSCFLIAMTCNYLISTLPFPRAIEFRSTPHQWYSKNWKVSEYLKNEVFLFFLSWQPIPLN